MEVIKRIEVLCSQRNGLMLFTLTPSQIEVSVLNGNGLFITKNVIPGKYKDMEVTPDGENIFVARQFAVADGDPEKFHMARCTLHLRFKGGMWRTHSFQPYHGKLKLLNPDLLLTGNVALHRKGRRWLQAGAGFAVV